MTITHFIKPYTRCASTLLRRMACCLRAGSVNCPPKGVTLLYDAIQGSKQVDKSAVQMNTSLIFPLDRYMEEQLRTWLKQASQVWVQVSLLRSDLSKTRMKRERGRGGHDPAGQPVSQVRVVVAAILC